MPPVSPPVSPPVPRSDKTPGQLEDEYAKKLQKLADQTKADVDFAPRALVPVGDGGGDGRVAVDLGEPHLHTFELFATLVDECMGALVSVCVCACVRALIGFVLPDVATVLLSLSFRAFSLSWSNAHPLPRPFGDASMQVRRERVCTRTWPARWCRALPTRPTTPSDSSRRSAMWYGTLFVGLCVV